MRIIETALFCQQRRQIALYIARDNLQNARHFVKKLQAKIHTLPAFPRQCRQSRYFNDANIRDLTFKGYTIPYRIRANTLEILQIFNQNEPKL